MNFYQPNPIKYAQSFLLSMSMPSTDENDMLPTIFNYDSYDNAKDMKKSLTGVIWHHFLYMKVFTIMINITIVSYMFASSTSRKRLIKSGIWGLFI